ncbi:MAG TPA: thiol:disulfide interchange protein DsbA/DsbL [Gammaproteobacteria bacterium]
MHYKRVMVEPPAVAGQVEVIEFFSYMCPHCADLAPHLKRWEKTKPANAKVTYVPAAFRESWILPAKAFYAFEILGVLEKAHPLMFNAIHVQRKPIETPEQIADLMTGIVNKQKLLDTLDSFAVDSRLRQGMVRTQKYRITGVPSIAVNGKYMTDGGLAGNYDNLLKIIDHLVRLEGRPKPAKAPVTAPIPAPAAESTAPQP